MTLTWRYVSHLATTTEHVLAERSEQYPRCHRELVTPYIHGRPRQGGGTWYYFIDGDPAGYKSADEMLAALKAAGGE